MVEGNTTIVVLVSVVLSIELLVYLFELIMATNGIFGRIWQS